MPIFDFTLRTYSDLLSALSHRSIYRFVDYCTYPIDQAIILRHDVDRRPLHSLRFAQMQHSLGIWGTYYFRIVPESFDPKVLEAIAGFGHEIGYHYEDVSLAASSNKIGKNNSKDIVAYQERLLEQAIESFAANLAFFRKYVDIRTICMHGSPRSPWDSRLLWQKYNYRDFDLLGEPYFDLNFNEVAYYTDTGRCWDGDRIVIRDKPMQMNPIATHGKTLDRTKATKSTSILNPQFPKFRSTFDIIHTAKQSALPEKIMFTFHPQRWHDSSVAWLSELFAQNAKNVVKRFFYATHS